MRNILVLVISLFAINANALSPVGLWKTIDDITNEPKSIVSISESPSNHQLSGKVVKLFKDPTRRCAACDGANRNQPIVGLTVIQSLHPTKEKDFWENGSILDPKSGKVYHCTLRLLEDGKKLQVRGYIGLPLFGRSQTWERV